MLSWNEARQHVDLGWLAADDPDEPQLQLFALTPQALLLIYDREVGFGYWSQGEEPDDTYRSPYQSLQAQPLLAWTRAGKPAVKKVPASQPKR